MDAAYRAALQAAVRANPDEWEGRVMKCGRRVISAVTFREVADSACQKTGTVLLSVIGHYYSVYHLAIAALYFDVFTQPGELRGMKHQKLRQLVQERLVNKKMLPKKYMRMLKELKTLRETANYAFGGKHEADRTRFYSIVPGLYRRTRKSFETAISLIHELGEEVDAGLGRSRALGSWIDDGIGNDAFGNYLSSEDQERVEAYLHSHGIYA